MFHMKKFKLKTVVFEFGCGIGTNFHAINCNILNCYCLGYDISPFAVRMADSLSKSIKWKFVNKINKPIVKNFLNYSNSKYFELSIYDRVLYNLSYKEVKEHFVLFNDFFKYIIIDDFVHTKSPFISGGYESKNYKKILNSIGFDLIEEKVSSHNKQSSDPFFEHAAKILIFKKRNV